MILVEMRLETERHGPFGMLRLSVMRVLSIHVRGAIRVLVPEAFHCHKPLRRGEQIRKLPDAHWIDGAIDAAFPDYVAPPTAACEFFHELFLRVR